MKTPKHIKRDGQEATTIFDNRSLETDYRTLKPLLKAGMRVLDVGCGTGAISKDIAQIVGPKGQVVGIDNTQKFIQSGQQSYRDIQNLTLIHADLFDFSPEAPFDLIVSARMLQWLNQPKAALIKMKSWLKPNGQISILDYNHENLAWHPSPPNSMHAFYQTFLSWRKDAGLNNRMADELSDLMDAAGFQQIEVINADEHYERTRADFTTKVGIWSKVAGSTQMVEEGYLDNELRLQAIVEYNQWVKDNAISMTMKLNEVRGYKPSPN